MPRRRHPSATSDADDDCHIANPRRRAGGRTASPDSTNVSMLPQVAAMAVNWVTACWASASSITRGSVDVRDDHKAHAVQQGEIGAVDEPQRVPHRGRRCPALTGACLGRLA